MADFLRTPNTVILPDLDKIEDEEVKKVLEEYNRILESFFIDVYTDLSWLHNRIYKLENP